MVVEMEALLGLPLTRTDLATTVVSNKTNAEP